MRRVVLVAVLAVVTALVVSVAPASAGQKGKLSGGNCFVEGKAKFAPALGGQQKAGTEYGFASAPVGAKHAGSEALQCTGTATGKEVNAKGETVAVSSTGPWKGVSAAVSGGKGNLSCTLAGTGRCSGVRSARRQEGRGASLGPPSCLPLARAAAERTGSGPRKGPISPGAATARALRRAIASPPSWAHQITSSASE